MIVNFYKKVVKLLQSIKRSGITTFAGAWVFSFIMALVPIFCLLTTAFNLFGVNLVYYLTAYLPKEFKLAGEVIAESVSRISSTATIFVAGSVVFSCTTMLAQMSRDGDLIYGFSKKGKLSRIERVWAVLALSVLFVFFIACALVVSFWNTLFSPFLISDKFGIIKVVLSFTLIILGAYSIIVMLNKYICPFNLPLSISLSGSLVSLFIIVLGTIGFIIYIRIFNTYGAFYGSLTAIAIFFLWTYILMLSLVAGAFVCKKLYFKTSSAEKSTLTAFMIK